MRVTGGRHTWARESLPWDTCMAAAMLAQTTLFSFNRFDNLAHDIVAYNPLGLGFEVEHHTVA